MTDNRAPGQDEGRVLGFRHPGTSRPRGSPGGLSWKVGRLNVGQAQLWLADLDAASNELEALSPTLSADEQERATRFRFEADRNRYVAGRGLLRLLLAGYLAVHPREIQLRYGPRGKPYLAEDLTLHFNLAHSQGLALYAIALGREVGVDLEAIRPQLPWESLAPSVLSKTEAAAVAALPEDRRVEAFLVLWTRKEALAKGIGDGLQIPLSRLEICDLDESAGGSPSPSPEAPPTGRPPMSFTGCGRWLVWDLYPAPGYAAALALQDIS